LFYIAFLQTVIDMHRRFGFPACFDAVDDHYQVQGTTPWIAVNYNGASAWGWRAWEVAS
jgi:hypothetical protein